MKHLIRWPVTIFAFLTMAVLLTVDAGLHRGDWWFYKLFSPIPARDVHITYVDDVQIELTYIPDGCQLVSIAAITVVGEGYGQIPVYTYAEEGLGSGLNRITVDTNLIGISFDQLKLYALWECSGRHTRRLLATLYGRNVGPAHQNYTGPEGGNIREE